MTDGDVKIGEKKGQKKAKEVIAGRKILRSNFEIKKKSKDG